MDIEFFVAWMAFWIGIGLVFWSVERKMDAYRKHVKACKKKGIKHDESMWVPR